MNPDDDAEVTIAADTGAYTIDISTIDMSSITGSMSAPSIWTTTSSNYYSVAGSGLGGAGAYGNVTINAGAGASWTSAVTGNGSLQVTGDADIAGDLKVKGVSIVDTLEKINQRLAILVPDPAKLEHFEALKKAYKHYKTLEAMCEIPEKTDDNS